MELATHLYGLSDGFPDSEKFGLSSQLRRAAVSVPSNIAEGHGRSSDRDFRRFLYMALGSLAELDTQLELAYRLSYIDQIQMEAVAKKLSEVRRMTTGLVAALDEE